METSKLLKEHDMKPYDLCKTSGIPCSTLSDFLNAHTGLIRLDTLLHVCEGFNMTLVDFFNHEYFEDVEQD